MFLSSHTEPEVVDKTERNQPVSLTPESGSKTRCVKRSLLDRKSTSSHS